MKKKILFKYPSRQRPNSFFEGLENLLDNLADKVDYHVSCTLDIDDLSMNNESVINRINSFSNVSIAWGVSKSKIHAVNRDLPNYGDIICVMSDDMRFRTYGYDNLIRQHMPTNLDGFLHCYDDYAKDRVCTVSILGLRYYQRDGYIYHGDYYSLWADNEATDVAKARDCYIRVPEVSIEHLHHTNNAKAKKDELYWRNDTYNADKAIYEQRKARNFYL